MRISDWSSDVCSSDLRSVIPASFSGDINVAGSAGGPRRPEKMPGRNRAEGIPADGANYGNAGPSGRLPVGILGGHRIVRQLAPRPCLRADGRPAPTPRPDTELGRAACREEG